MPLLRVRRVGDPGRAGEVALRQPLMPLSLPKMSKRDAKPAGGAAEAAGPCARRPWGGLRVLLAAPRRREKRSASLQCKANGWENAMQDRIAPRRGKKRSVRENRRCARTGEHNNGMRESKSRGWQAAKERR